MSGFYSKSRDAVTAAKVAMLMWIVLLPILAFGYLGLHKPEYDQVRSLWLEYQVCVTAKDMGLAELALPSIPSCQERLARQNEVLTPQVLEAWNQHRHVLIGTLPLVAIALVVLAVALWNVLSRWSEFEDQNRLTAAKWSWAVAASAISILLGLWQGYGESFTLLSAFGVFVFVGAILAIIGWRSGKEANAAADVNEDVERLTHMQASFDPERHIKLSRGVFLGLDAAGQAVYIPHSTLFKNHVEIMGASGTGKSSIAGVLMVQLLGLGETVVVFDPKDDRFLLGALARMAHKYNRPVHILDLRVTAPSQINPFLHCTPNQVEELLQVALELGKTGDPAVDFHRGADREATGWMADTLQSSDGCTSMSLLLDLSSRDERITAQVNLWREFRQLARLHSIQAESGLDLRACVLEGGLLYVIGSTTDFKAQAAARMVLQRTLQLIDERPNQDIPICLFMDELKYLLSGPTLRAAGTVRDRNCHLIMAHQSLGDLHDCPGLSPQAVEGSVWGNASLRFVYRVEEPETARRLEQMAGKRRGTAVSNSINQQRGIAGDTSDAVSVRVQETPLIPAHVFTNMPKPTLPEHASVGVVFGIGTAFYLSTRYLNSGPKPQLVEAARVGVKTDNSEPDRMRLMPTSSDGKSILDDLA